MNRGILHAADLPGVPRDKRPARSYTWGSDVPLWVAAMGEMGRAGAVLPRFFAVHEGGSFVSIVRIGLSQNKGYSEGYDSIFGKKQDKKGKKKSAAKASAAKKPKKRKKK
jgi:hypothetical protein